MSEPFPLLSTAADQLHALSVENAAAVRRRRKSSGLGAAADHEGVAMNGSHVKVWDWNTEQPGGPTRTPPRIDCRTWSVAWHGEHVD